MSSGKNRRLMRLFNENGKALIVPMDHGITMGPIAGIEDIKVAVKKIIECKVNGIILHKGMAEYVVEDIPVDKALGIHLNAGTSLKKNNTQKSIVCTVEDALYYGADFVSYQLNLGTDEESIYFSEIEKIQSKCKTYGLPLLGMLYTREIDSDYSLLHAIRVSEELGFDMVKVSCPTNLDTLEKAVKICHIPIFIAGGESMDDNLFLEKVNGICKTGVAGFAVGRNIFDNSNSNTFVNDICKVMEK